MAMYSSLRGRAMENNFSKYLKIDVYICSSDNCFEPSSGTSLCVPTESKNTQIQVAENERMRGVTQWPDTVPGAQIVVVHSDSCE
jgi:hypothetical protein